MNDEKVICKAEIRPKPSKVVFIVWYILGAIAFGYGTFFISSERCRYLFFVRYYYLVYNTYDDTFGAIYSRYFSLVDLFLGILITIGVIILPIILRKIRNRIAENCFLFLIERGINGSRKKVFSSAQLNLPIDKIDNIMISQSIFDNLRGGKTVVVRSTSGLIKYPWVQKFPWVQNAEEFVDAVLAKINRVESSVTNEQASPLNSNYNSVTNEQVSPLNLDYNSETVAQEGGEKIMSETTNTQTSPSYPNYNSGTVMPEGNERTEPQTANMQTPPPYPNYYNDNRTMPTNKNKTGGFVFFSIVGILSGLLSIAFGLYELDMYPGSNERDITYGGDAYTGIQNAAAQAANNVWELSYICRFGFGAILIVLGIAIVCYFGVKLCDKKNS